MHLRRFRRSGTYPILCVSNVSLDSTGQLSGGRHIAAQTINICMEETVEIEVQQGINLAKAASKTPSLRHDTWSSLPDNIKISCGKCSIPHFESKVKVDQFIKRDKDLLIKATFLWVTYYANICNL